MTGRGAAYNYNSVLHTPLPVRGEGWGEGVLSNLPKSYGIGTSTQNLAPRTQNPPPPNPRQPNRRPPAIYPVDVQYQRRDMLHEHRIPQPSPSTALMPGISSARPQTASFASSSSEHTTTSESRRPLGFSKSCALTV